MLTRTFSALLISLGMFSGACTPSSDIDNDATSLEVTVPAGFRLEVVADSVGRARHIAVRENGDLYVRLRKATAEGHTLVALRDADGDGRAEQIEYFGETGGTGLHIRNGYLYYSSDTTIYRVELGEGLIPTAEPETVIAGFPTQPSHAPKSMAFDDQGNLFVNIGAPSNACMTERRTAGSEGIDPCPQLEGHAGIWRYSADKINQTYNPANRYVTGIRNAMALDWNPLTKNLYSLQHGRDQLANFWPDLYEAAENPEMPAEEFFLLEEGANYGWPYCYYDPFQQKKVLGPEYGGDRNTVGRCEDAKDPIMAFPGHWAPNDLLFYTGDQFPESYQGGAFIAFHGSWNRAPSPQKGYNVVFVPFEGDLPSGEYEIFADHFAGTDSLDAPNNAVARPVGLAQGPDGSLYISDSQKGKIWRVRYAGERVAMR